MYDHEICERCPCIKLVKGFLTTELNKKLFDVSSANRVVLPVAAEKSLMPTGLKWQR